MSRASAFFFNSVEEAKQGRRLSLVALHWTKLSLFWVSSWCGIKLPRNDPWKNSSTKHPVILIESNRIKSNQIESNRIKSNRIDGCISEFDYDNICGDLRGFSQPDCRYAATLSQRRRNSAEMRNKFDSGQRKQIIKMTRGSTMRTSGTLHRN